MGCSVIFLDIDGVLVTTRSFASGKDAGQSAASFDQVGVGLVKELCDLTGAKIVVCSSWRLSHTTFDLVDIFDSNGLASKYFHSDMLTPELSPSKYVEIDAWLEGHRGEIDGYVIIDDQVSMSDPCAVVPNYSDGIQWRDFLRAYRILTGKDYKEGAKDVC